MEKEFDTEGKNLKEWFTDNAFPLFGALDGESFGPYVERGNGMIWGLFDMADRHVPTLSLNTEFNSVFR